jgi:hypothetical protein
MPGKPREDRATIRDHHLGLRLSATEAGLLEALVRHVNAKLRAGGLPGICTQTALVVMLITQEAERANLTSSRK